MTVQTSKRSASESAPRPPIDGAVLREPDPFRRLQTIFEVMADGVAVHDPTGAIIQCNPAAERILGLSADEILGREARDPMWRLIDTSRQPLPPDLIPSEITRRTGRSVRGMVLGVQVSGGSIRWLSINTEPICVIDQPHPYVVASFTDVTEQREAEARLLESQHFFDAVSRAAPNCFYIFDLRTGSADYANRSLLQELGYGIDALATLACFVQLLHPDDQPGMAHMYSRWETAKDGEVLEAEWRARHADGTYRWFLSRETPFERDAAGKVVRYVGTIQDITARRDLEERLRHNQKMEAVGRLAGGVAHDFNNFLTVMNGHASLLASRLPPGRDRDAAIQILDAGQRAAAVTSQLLTLGRRAIASPSVIDLGRMLAGSRQLIAGMLGENIGLTIDASPDCAIRVDDSHLNQILMNLVVNARDAMPGGGRLHIRAFLRPRADVAPTPPQPGAACELTCVCLTLSDTGHGMPAEVLQRAFEPFFTTKEVGKGTGLGLALVDRLARQAGGCVHATSEVGGGTTFTLRFPRATPDPAAEVALDTTLEGQTPARILLVEDDAAVRGLVQSMLSAAGHRVLVAASGSEALDLLDRSTEPIDLLLADMSMPGMGGREVAAEATRRRPTLKVLFMSGYTDDAVIRDGVSTASLAFLQKPFSIETLIQKIAEALGR